ncbi:MAG: DUF222 domain-containing protein, partial [Actinomycetota bacterium]
MFDVGAVAPGGGFCSWPPVVDARGAGPGRLADVLDRLGPGPDLLAVLAGVDVAGLAEEDLLAALVAWERCAGWVAAGGLGVLAELADRVCAAEGSAGPGRAGVVAAEEVLAAEVGTALRWSTGVVHRRVELARALAGRCAPTGAALAAGRIGLGQAWAVVEELTGAAEGVAAQVQDRVLPRAERTTAARTRAAVRRELLRADPAVAARR